MLIMVEEEGEVLPREIAVELDAVDHDHVVEVGALHQEMGEVLTEGALRDVPITDKIMKTTTQLNHTTTRAVEGAVVMMPVVGTKATMATGTTISKVDMAVATMMTMRIGKSENVELI